MINNTPYGKQDNSYQAAGQEPGIRKLVTDFYQIMATNPNYQTIFNMHPKSLAESIDRLTCFLCGWLGGPKMYKPKYGGINIPTAHQHLPIGEKERDQWLACMYQAIQQQDFAQDFKEYLYQQLTVPANAIYKRCSQKNKQTLE